MSELVEHLEAMARIWPSHGVGGTAAKAAARIAALEAALREAIEFAEQDYMVLTPAGETMLAEWRATLASPPAKGKSWIADLLAAHPAPAPEGVSKPCPRCGIYPCQCDPKGPHE